MDVYFDAFFFSCKKATFSSLKLTNFQGEMADNEGSGDKDEAAPDQPPGPEVGEEVELQSQLSESGSVQESEVTNNPRGVSRIVKIDSGV